MDKISNNLEINLNSFDWIMKFLSKYILPHQNWCLNAMYMVEVIIEKLMIEWINFNYLNTWQLMFQICFYWKVQNFLDMFWNWLITLDAQCLEALNHLKTRQVNYENNFRCNKVSGFCFIKRVLLCPSIKSKLS